MQKNKKEKQSKIRKIFLWLGKSALIALVSLILIILITILLYWQTNIVADGVAKYINSYLKEKGKVEYGIVSGSLINSINIDSIYFELYDQVAITSKDIQLKYDLWAILSGDIKINSVYIDSIDVSLMVAQADEQIKKPFNLDSLLTKIQNSHFLDSLFAIIPNTELEAFEIKTGYIQIPAKQLTFKNIHIQADAYFRPDDFGFNLNHFSGYWLEKDFRLENLTFQILGNKEQITLNRFQLDTGSGETNFVLTGDLEVENLFLILAVEDFYLDFNSFTGFDPLINNKGFSKGSFTLIGTPQNFSVSTNVSGRWKDYSLHSFNLDAYYDVGNIHIDTFLVSATPGNVNLTADINPFQSAAVDLNFSKINAHEIDTSFAHSNINGKLKLNFPKGSFNINKVASTFKTLTGNGELILNDSYYDNSRLDSLRFAFQAEKGDYNIKQPSFIKIANQARFDIFGNLTRDKTLDLQVYTYRGNLNNLTTALGVDSMYGSYYADFRAFGDLNDPAIAGDFQITNFSYREINLDSVDLNLQFSNLLTEPLGIANFNIKKGVVYEIPIRDVSLNVSKMPTVLHITNARIFSNDNYIESRLDIFQNHDTTFVQVNHLRMDYENYWLQNSEQILIQVDSTFASIKNFNLSGPNNTMFLAEGIYNFSNDDMGINLNLSSLDVEPFQQFIGQEHQVSGILSGKADFERRADKPDLKVDLRGKGISYNDVSFGDFKADLEYNQEKVFIREFSLNVDSTRLLAEGDLAFQFGKDISQILELIQETKTNLKIEWENVELQRFNSILALKHPVRGNANGYLEVEGTINDPFMRQFLQMNNFKYDNFEVDSLVMYSQYNSGYLLLDSLGAQLNGTPFEVKGYQQIDLSLGEADTSFMDNPFDLYIKSKDDRIDFISLFNEQIESIIGPYEIEINMSGTPQSPTINSGKILMAEGTLLLSRVKDPIKNVAVDIEIEDNVLTINNFRGKSPREQDFLQIGYSYVKKLWSWMFPKEEERGVLVVGGTIDLENVFRPDMDLNIAMNKFFVDYFIENTKVMVSTDSILIKGQEVITVKGDVIIPSGEFEVNIDQIQKNIYLSQPAGGVSNLELDLKIEIPGNFVVTSSALDFQNNFKIVLQGDLQANMAPGSKNVAVIGVMETESGKFSSYNQSFNVTSGTINFNNPLRINPELDIIAKKKLQNKNFELIISGNLESIRQDIKIRDENGQELNLSPQDKIAMLTLGADLTMLSANTDSTLRGVGEDVAQNVVLTAAERGVEELTGFDKVEISSSDKLLDLQKLKLNNGLKQASIAFGKYLTSDLYVEYRTQFGSGMPTPKLSWDAGNRISLQYRINKLWSLESHYEKTVPDGNNKVLLGVSWEYTFK